MKVKTQAIDAVLEQTITSRELAPGVSAYKVTREVIIAADEVPAWFRGFLKDQVLTGITETCNIEAFEKGELETPYGSGGFKALPPEYLALVQQQGFHALDQDHEELSALVHDTNRDPLSTPATWSVVKVDRGGHMLFAIDDTPLPVGLLYNYMSGHVRDGSYDIPKLIAYLKTHPQVSPQQGSSEGITEQRVPYFNVSPGCNIFTSFVFAPTQEQMLQIWAKAKELNPKYPSTVLHEAVFALDVLGLRAAGIALSDSYYGRSYPEGSDFDEE